MPIIKPSTAFKAGADWVSAEVRAYIKDQVATHVDTVADVRDNDFEQTRFVYVRSKATLYRLDLSSGAADDGDTVLQDNVGRRYVKVAGSTISLLGIPQVDDLTARGAYDNEDPGFMVLVSDTGSGRAAIYTMGDGGSGDWSDPAYLTPASVGGDVVGPASATDGNVPVFDGTTGKLVKDAGFAPADASATYRAAALGPVANRLVPAEPAAVALDLIALAGLIRDNEDMSKCWAGDVNDILSYLSPSPKYIWNRSGILVPGTTLRCDHDPATGEALGVRVEGQATNLVTDSEDLSSWGISSNAVLTTDAATAPDGSLTADHYAPANGIASFISGNPIKSISSVLQDEVYTFSHFIKAGGATAVRIDLRKNNLAVHIASAVFDLAAGDVHYVSETGDMTLVSASIEQLPDGWFRYQISAASTGTDEPLNEIRVREFAYAATGTAGASFTGDGIKGLYVWGAQFEAGPKATSYIKTTASEVTRAEDDITLPLADFPWNGGSGALTLNGNAVSPILTGGADALDISAIVAAAEVTHIESLTWVPA